MRTLDAFSQLESLLRQNTLKLRIEHENLETVYLEPTSDGRILVHDRAHAYTYLSTAIPGEPGIALISGVMIC